MQKSTLPRSRMSVEGHLGRAGTTSQVAGIQAMPMNQRMSIGLPPMRIDNQRVQSTKSLNVSGVDRISMYRNEDERQEVMKQISDH